MTPVLRTEGPTRVRRGGVTTDSIAPSKKSPLALVLLACAILATAYVLLLSVIPDRELDRGIFISTASRLLAGDTLYRDVYDNKEPLFYYLVAGEVYLGKWSEPFVELILIGTIIGTAYWVGRKLGPRPMAAATAFLPVPAILIGYGYHPGYTELPGVAVSLLVFAASFFGRSVIAGLLIGLLVFMKLPYAPIALVIAVSVSVATGRLSDLYRIAISLALAVAMISSVLLLRGELLPFLETTRANFGYANGELTSASSWPGRAYQHLQRVGGWQAAKVVAINIALIAFSFTLLPGNAARAEIRATRAAGVAALLGATLILMSTGLFIHHSLVLAIPTVITLLLLNPLAGCVVNRRGEQPFIHPGSIAAIVLVALCIAGTGWPRGETLFPGQFETKLANLNATPPEARLLSQFGLAREYARLGGNDDQGAAVGLGGWQLVCPRFHQYPFESGQVLDAVYDCAKTAPVLVVSKSLAPDPERKQWNAFVDKSRRCCIPIHALQPTD